MQTGCTFKCKDFPVQDGDADSGPTAKRRRCEPPPPVQLPSAHAVALTPLSAPGSQWQAARLAPGPIVEAPRAAPSSSAQPAQPGAAGLQQGPPWLPPWLQASSVQYSPVAAPVPANSSSAPPMAPSGWAPHSQPAAALAPLMITSPLGSQPSSGQQEAGSISQPCLLPVFEDKGAGCDVVGLAPLSPCTPPPAAVQHPGGTPGAPSQPSYSPGAGGDVHGRQQAIEGFGKPLQHLEAAPPGPSPALQHRAAQLSVLHSEVADFAARAGPTGDEAERVSPPYWISCRVID